MHYVVGFAFDELLERVVLIQKNRPLEHAGLLNGPGGAVEKGEAAEEAMAREFHEETGLDTQKLDGVCWRRFVSMATAQGHRIDFFYTTLPDVTAVRTTTDEDVRVLYVHNLLVWPSVANLRWLVEMALSIATRKETVHSFHVVEHWY